MIQLDLFETDDTVLLINEVKKVKESTEKTRKALFSRHGSLEKKYNELVARLDVLEKYICRDLDGNKLNLQLRE